MDTVQKISQRLDTDNLKMSRKIVFFRGGVWLSTLKLCRVIYVFKVTLSFARATWESELLVYLSRFRVSIKAKTQSSKTTYRVGQQKNHRFLCSKWFEWNRRRTKTITSPNLEQFWFGHLNRHALANMFCLISIFFFFSYIIVTNF